MDSNKHLSILILQETYGFGGENTSLHRERLMSYRGRGQMVHRGYYPFRQFPFYASAHLCLMGHYL